LRVCLAVESGPIPAFSAFSGSILGIKKIPELIFGDFSEFNFWPQKNRKNHFRIFLN